MRITKDNCEAFFLDYHEGNLNLQQVAELMIFLEQNPDLKKDFEGFENILLEAEDLRFSSKASLKKNGPAELENELIGLIEGRLSPEQKNGLEARIKNEPVLQIEMEKFRQTILVPDTDIVYNYKDSLKKKDKKAVVISLYQYLAAASVAILAGLYFFFNLSDPKPVNYSRIEKRHLPVGTFNKNLNSPVIHEKNISPAPVSGKKHPLKQNIEIKESPATIENELATANIDTVPEKSVNNENSALAVVEPAEKNPSFKTISASDFIEKPKEEPVKKTSFWDLVALCSKGINKMTGKKLEIKKEVDSDNSRVEYVVSAGRYGFSRSVAK